jgi:hypothetical protein
VFNEQIRESRESHGHVIFSWSFQGRFSDDPGLFGENHGYHGIWASIFTVGSCTLPCVQSWDFDELEWPQWLTSRNHPSWGWWTIIIHHHSFWQNTKWELRHWLNYGLIWWFGGVLPKWSTVCELCKFDLAFLNAFNAMLMTGKSRHSRPLNAKHCLTWLG